MGGGVFCLVAVWCQDLDENGMILAEEETNF
jgi:hypothetical protein